MGPTRTGYPAPARLLHWIVAILVLMMIPAGIVMVQEGLTRSLQDTLFIFHKNTGVVVLLFVIARLAYRRFRPPPPLPADMPDWQRRAAAASHAALYVLLVVVPVAGYVRVRAGGFPVEALDAMGIPTLVPRSDALAGFAQSVHWVGGLALATVVVVHVGAALFHGLVRRDGVFGRMWPPVPGRGA